jgi:hypothetical protein
VHAPRPPPPSPKRPPRRPPPRPPAIGRFSFFFMFLSNSSTLLIICEQGLRWQVEPLNGIRAADLQCTSVACARTQTRFLSSLRPGGLLGRLTQSLRVLSDAARGPR